MEAGAVLTHHVKPSARGGARGQRLQVNGVECLESGAALGHDLLQLSVLTNERRV